MPHPSARHLSVVSNVISRRLFHVRTSAVFAARSFSTQTLPFAAPTGIETPASLANGTLTPTQQLFASVVKVFCDHTDPNFCQPWQMRRQGSSTGSGFAIEGQRIMTNAHCVSFQNRVLVRKPGDAFRYPARVEAIAHECDLAILRVEDPTFWNNVPELPFGDLPHLHDSVVVVGYPTGGDNLSITAGVVSRLDVTTYAHSNFKLLCAQIDAAINPGNSGGPAFRFPDGVVCGVAFQGYGDAQNIGYIVPTNVILRFLSDVEKHGAYTGFVALGVTYQTLENSALKKFFGLEEMSDSALPVGVTPTGVLIAQVDEVRNAQFEAELNEKLNEREDKDDKKKEKKKEEKEDEHEEKKIGSGFKKNDVLLALDGVDVAGDGTIHFRGMERVHLSHVTTSYFSGESIPALILRDRQLMKIDVPLYPPKYLVPEHQWDMKPSYFIYGGLVFCPLTLDYLKDEFGKKYYERAPTSLMEPLSTFFPKSASQEIVILSQILASDLTLGYETKNSRLHEVDGIAIQNMAHLVEVLGRNSGNPFVDFLFDHGVRVIMDREAIREKSPSILNEHGIAKPWSENLDEIVKQEMKS